MLTGWVAQQRSRLLVASTVEQRVLVVRRFVAFSNDYPWRWGPADVEEWTTSLVSQGLAHSTIRNYQQSVQLFCGYLTDRRYGWDELCEQRFGTHPVQVFHEWNIAAHRAEVEARPGNRPLSRDELQAFFDYCDDRVGSVHAAGRKGWLSAFRDATLFKTIYGWGLRRREAAMLEIADLSGNANTPEFGRYGAVSVRYGKALKGSRAATADGVDHHGLGGRGVGRMGGADPSRVRFGRVDAVAHRTWRPDLYRPHQQSIRCLSRRLGLPAELGPHCLRHSYVSHLLEDGFDQLFVQQQVGHSWGSTTALYTTVGSDYKNRALRQALDRAFTDPDGPSTTRERKVMARNKLGYQWHLRMRMAEAGMFATTDLTPLLAERGVVLSAAQTYRLVTGTPERLSLRILMALCDILDCTPNDLIEPVTATKPHTKATGTSGQPAARSTGPAPQDGPRSAATNEHSVVRQLRSAGAVEGRQPCWADCSACHARRNTGTCGSCGREAILVGRNPDGEPWCSRCYAASAAAHLADERREIVLTAVTLVDPDLARKPSWALFDAAGTRALPRLSAHLGAHPEALRKGPNSHPPALGRFVQALAAAGSQRIGVIHPICADCGRRRPVKQQLEGAVLCGACHARRSAVNVCVECGERRRVVHDQSGALICQLCLSRKRTRAAQAAAVAKTVAVLAPPDRTG